MQKNHKLLIRRAIRSNDVFELHQAVVEFSNDEQARTFGFAVGAVLIVALFKVYMLDSRGLKGETRDINQKTYELLERLIKEKTPGVN
jgi:hypothetical protein